MHLGVGQEAVATGLSNIPAAKTGSSRLQIAFACPTSLGASVHELFAEVLKQTGLSHGMGGSMHLQDRQGLLWIRANCRRNCPACRWRGACRKDGWRGHVAVTYLGDGAVEEGAVQETSILLKRPVALPIIGNLLASHMHISLRQEPARHKPVCRGERRCPRAGGRQ